MFVKATVCVFVLAVVVCSSADECLRACPRNMDPVCATYIKTYGNECMMKADACSLAKKDLILRTHKTEMCTCERACPYNLSPFFCATDGKNYDNECMMKVEACKTKSWIEKAADGACSSVGVSDTRK